jgi:hypothetical protein
MIVVLGDLILYVVPGLGAVVLGYRWLKTKVVVSGLRETAVRSDAELEAAQDAARVAQGTAREQRALIGDALDRLKTVEHMDKTITGFVGFLMNEVRWRGGDAPALPGAQGELPAGDSEDGGRWS